MSTALTYYGPEPGVVHQFWGCKAYRHAIGMPYCLSVSSDVESQHRWRIRPVRLWE